MRLLIHLLILFPIVSFLNLPANAADFRTEPGIPVLCYHQIVTESEYRNKPTEYAITDNQFREQMRWLSENGYRTVNLAEMESYLNGRVSWKQISSKGLPVLITFDDGLSDFLRFAEPEMNQYKFKGVLFIYPTYIMAKKSRALTWIQISQIHQRGHEIQSHTFWHPLLRDMSAPEQRSQFAKSRQILSKQTNADVTSLAYPFGVYTHESAGLLMEESYRTAFTIFPGNNLPGNDPYHLRRYLVVRGDSLPAFVAKLRIRALPVANIRPAPGSFPNEGESATLTLPAGLDVNNLRFTSYSVTIPFTYKSDSGLVLYRVPTHRNKIMLFRMVYKDGKNSYQTEFLYNRPGK